jgi:Tfp pilus assembly protein PilZ
MTQDRRKRVRYDVNYPAVMLTSHGVLKGEAKNLSQHGAYIHCQHPLEVNEKILLIIELPLDEPLDVPAHVVWTKTTDADADGLPQGMGVRFTW